MYISEKGQISNADCDFITDPPTMQNIRDAEKQISTKYYHSNKVAIANWLKISE